MFTTKHGTGIPKQEKIGRVGHVCYAYDLGVVELVFVRENLGKSWGRSVSRASDNESCI